jgi:4a-hydroxytetrahydrobiopterin dehydratase
LLISQLSAISYWLSAIRAATMSALTNEKCTACRRDSPRVTEAEISELKPLIPDWTLVERDGIQRLERVFKFGNFAEALNFTNRVGAIAEEEGHHPAILTEWGRVTVTLWTHKIRALHRNDFIMAAKIDGTASR